MRSTLTSAVRIRKLDAWLHMFGAVTARIAPEMTCPRHDQSYSFWHCCMPWDIPFCATSKNGVPAFPHLGCPLPSAHTTTVTPSIHQTALHATSDGTTNPPLSLSRNVGAMSLHQRKQAVQGSTKM